MCVDKIEFLEINWIFDAIYENDSYYLEIFRWSTENPTRYNNILTFAVICGYIIMLLSIIGIVMNLIVITVLLSNLKEATSTTVFILSLACSDILTVLIPGPISVVNLLWGDWVFDRWFGNLGSIIICKFFHMFYTYSVLASSWTLCVMTYERFMAIFYPLKSRSQRTVKRAIKFVIGIWIIDSSTLSLTMFYSDVKPTPTGCHRCYVGVPYLHYLQYLWFASWMDFLCTYFLPLTVILAFNIAILIKVTKSGTIWNGQRSQQRHGHKTLLMIILIVGAFAICWFPFQCLYLMNMFKVLKRKFAPEYLIFGYTLGFANSCINPIIYSLLSENFRKSCSDTFKRFASSMSKSLRVSKSSDRSDRGHQEQTRQTESTQSTSNQTPF